MLAPSRSGPRSRYLCRLLQSGLLCSFLCQTAAAGEPTPSWQSLLNRVREGESILVWVDMAPLPGYGPAISRKLPDCEPGLWRLQPSAVASTGVEAKRLLMLAPAVAPAPSVTATPAATVAPAAAPSVAAAPAAQPRWLPQSLVAPICVGPV